MLINKPLDDSFPSLLPLDLALFMYIIINIVCLIDTNMKGLSNDVSVMYIVIRFR